MADLVSKRIIDELNENYQETLKQWIDPRDTKKRTGQVRVIIKSRVCEHDITGEIVDDGTLDLLKLPMKFEK